MQTEYLGHAINYLLLKALFVILYVISILGTYESIIDARQRLFDILNQLFFKKISIFSL